MTDLAAIPLPPRQDSAERKPSPIMPQSGDPGVGVSGPAVRIPVDQIVETPAPKPKGEEMPLPSDPKTAFLGGLFVLAALAACFVAQPIIVPVVMAFFLKLLLQPVVRGLHFLKVPRPIAAILAMLLLASVLLGLGVALSVPAASWGDAVSKGFPRLEQRLKPLQGPISHLQEFLTKAQQATGGAKSSVPIAVERVGVLDLVFSGTRAALEGLLTTAVTLFFLILSGDTFLRRAVEIMPNFEQKRRAVEISQQVEADISVYLYTILAMNGLVGIAVGGAMWLCGMDDPLLWGALAFILNFVPILGPLCGVALFVLAGFMQFDSAGPALLPAAIYFGIHVVEGEVLTPSLLARRFTLNPVAVILALIFWYWMWGVPGAVLAVPMLAIAKVVCDRIAPFRALGHLLEGEESVGERYVAAYAKNRSKTRS